jgi:diguanylate cyclase (GGDEF)-like protein/PAS domain S-box-containing protein
MNTPQIPDVANMDTTSRRLLVRLVLSFVGGVFALTLFEFAQALLLPAPDVWQARLVTIIFSALLVTACTYFVSRRDFSCPYESKRQPLAQAIQAEHEFTNILLDSLGDGVLACDVTGKLVLFNRMAREWHGVDARRLTPQEWMRNQALYAADGITLLPFEEMPLLRACRGETVRDAEIVIRAKGQPPRRVVVNGGPFFDKRGKKLGAVLALHDITQRKQMEEALSEEQRLVRVLMENIPDTIYFKDTQGRFLRISQSQAEILGVSDPQQAIGKTDFDFFGREHAQAACEDEQEIMRTGQPKVDLEEMLNWPDRPPRWVSATKMPLRDKAGNIVGTFGISRDITERKQTEQALAYEQYLVQSLMDNIPDAIYFKDLQSRFIRVNKAAAHLASIKPEDVVGKTDFDFFAPEYAQVTYAVEQEIIRTGQPKVDDERLETAPGQPPRWVSATKMPLHDKTGKIIGTFGITRDVTARKRAEDQLLYLSTHDVLTGLYNRTYFEEVMVHISHGNPFPVSIIIADIDGMKRINDTQGHPAGDELLRRTAEVLRSACRGDDIVARIGGDEFAVLLLQTDHVSAQAVLRRLRGLLAEHNGTFDGTPLNFSMGVATAYEHALLSQTVNVADQEMYREKQEHHRQLAQPAQKNTK